MDFPFLNEADFGEISFKTRRRMSPLYKQLFYVSDPKLCFVGIPHSVVPFPMMEAQAECIAETVLYSEMKLPPADILSSEALKDHNSGGSKGQRVEDTHYLGSAQWDYLRDLAKLGGLMDDEYDTFLKVQEAIYDDAHESRMKCKKGNDDYRGDIYTKNKDGTSWEKVDRKMNESCAEQVNKRKVGEII